MFWEYRAVRAALGRTYCVPVFVRSYLMPVSFLLVVLFLSLHKMCSVSVILIFTRSPCFKWDERVFKFWLFYSTLLGGEILKPKMAKYEACNGLNNKSLLWKHSCIPINDNIPFGDWDFVCVRPFGHMASRVNIYFKWKWNDTTFAFLLLQPWVSANIDNHLILFSLKTTKLFFLKTEALQSSLTNHYIV